MEASLSTNAAILVTKATQNTSLNLDIVWRKTSRSKCGKCRECRMQDVWTQDYQNEDYYELINDTCKFKKRIRPSYQLRQIIYQNRQIN